MTRAMLTIGCCFYCGPLAIWANGISNKCLNCLCVAASLCDQTRTCNGGACGPYRIIKDYWIDGGLLTVGGESYNSSTAFHNCVFNKACARNTVRNYMKRYKEDCNGDGQINCKDYFAIHEFGPIGCSSHSLSATYENVYNTCVL